MVSGYLRLRMPEKKRCNTNRRKDISRFSGDELWKQVPKPEFIIKPRRGEEVADELSDNSSRFPKMDFHN